MRPPPIAVALLLAFGVAAGAHAQLPSTPQLPTLGHGLFGKRSVDPAQKAEGAPAPVPSPALFSHAPTTLAGREATLQALQDCYAREAPKVKASGAPDSRVRRLRQRCENEQIADMRAWLKWSKIGSGRAPQRILNALQEDAAQKALIADGPTAVETP